MELFHSNILQEVELFVGRSLNQKDDLQLIIGVCLQNNLMEDFEKLAFTGKYVHGLLRVLSNSDKIPEVKSVDHIKKDLSENLEMIISQLKNISIKMSNGDKENIEKKYFEVSKNSFNNLQLLSEDLNSIKKYLNDLKRK